MKTINKNVLRQGYYYESKKWFDALPDTLTVPTYATEIFPTAMSHRDILKTYKVKEYTIEEAFAVAADCIPTLKNDYNGRIIYFMDGDTRYRLHVYRNGDGELRVNIYYVNLDTEWDAGHGVLFSNDTQTLSTDFLENLDTLALAIQTCKDNGLEVIRRM